VRYGHLPYWPPLGGAVEPLPQTGYDWRVRRAGEDTRGADEQRPATPPVGRGAGTELKGRKAVAQYVAQYVATDATTV
jgi:hypothetical protein